MHIKHLPNDDSDCGWTNSLPHYKSHNFSGSIDSNWVIVGAGITGLSAARQLALHRPEDKIILLDAQQIADGSSGRNSGFLIDLPHDLSAADYIGDINNAHKDMALNRAAISHLRNIVQSEKIECHWRECGKIQGAVNARGVKVLDAYRTGLDRLGAEYKTMNKEAMQRKLGTSYYCQGLFTPGTILVQPAALMRGLASKLPSNVQLCEKTPVTHIEYGDTIELKTPTGIIKTAKLLLTNNAFASQFGFFNANELLPIFTYGGMTRQLTEEEQALLEGDPYWGVIPADPFGTTLRRTPDQRITVRNSFRFNPSGKCTDKNRSYIKKHLINAFRARFPTLSHVEIQYVWGGAMCMTRNHAPYFGQLSHNVFGAGGYNGLGLTKGAIAGKLLADYLIDKNSDLLGYMLEKSKPVFNPPRPILDIGINTNLMYNQWLAGSER